MFKTLLMVIAYSFLGFQLAATELKPWYGRIYDLDFRASSLLQQFNKLDTACGKVKRPEFDAFYHLSAHFVAKENLTAEMEVSALDSRHRLFGMQAFRLTGRYFVFNDVIGDPVSFAAGMTLSKIFHAARRNLATFDHGGVACEGHIALGKELLSCEEFWLSRIFGVFGIGIADVGSPWMRVNLAWERNWWERHQLKAFAHSLWGFGRNHLNLCHSFHGYGSINYQTVEVGLCYGFRLDNDALLSLSYAFRVYGRNCPSQVNYLQFELCYPFNL